MPNKLAEFGGGLCDCCAGGVGTCMYVSCCPLCAYAQTTAEADVGCGCCLECLMAHWLPCMIPFRMGEVNEKLGGGDDTCSRGCLLLFCYPCVLGCMICQYGRAVKEAKKQGLLGHGGVVLQAPQQQQDMDRQAIPMAQIA
ncbi:hypothetical protein BASA81_002736 [Batrachochytrium salamandrivorans]|nr:hypothetical protein BASA81_002736 [Batrachochytrium salamandrivorans]